MIFADEHDVQFGGSPEEIIFDFQKIVACLRKYVQDTKMTVNSKEQPDEVVIEIFCQALAMANGHHNVKCSITEVSNLEKALKYLREDREDE